ncbi:MAG: homoserine O-acetyltransferase [Pseudomonadota bacterium]
MTNAALHAPDGATLRLPRPLRLASGATLEDLEIGYASFGRLDADRSNVVLVCHALTGDQFVGDRAGGEKPGWWSAVIGPGRPIDTDRYFVLCTNVLGGCSGSTGPASAGPSGGAHALDFPVITIADMVAAQAALLDALGIGRLLAVIGGSMGGMQALQWATSFGDRMDAVAAIASAARHTPQNIAFHEIGRQAVMADPDWRGGRYAEEGVRPAKGLAVARMTAHVTYLSESALNRKFGRALQDRAAIGYGFDADFQVESYLRHQGKRFVERFDANSYLYITRAMDYFDLAEAAGGRLADAFAGLTARAFIASFTSDWLYPTAESRAIVRALHAAGVEASFAEIESDKGHDAFLLDEPELHRLLAGFLSSTAERRGA